MPAAGDKRSLRHCQEIRTDLVAEIASAGMPRLWSQRANSHQSHRGFDLANSLPRFQAQSKVG